MIKFRDYQKEIIDKSLSVLLKHRFVYLAMEVRTGKTFTSLGIAQALFLKKNSGPGFFLKKNTL